MESDQKIENVESVNNAKGAPTEIVLSNKHKEEIIMDTSNSRINAQATQVSLASAKGLSNANSPKMGSRRIFTPQFKLQVLESYRNDHDCKGNQRATARKYNIHRRQIQKWLQCEQSLRSSVANINQNSVKHQFHNVNMQPQQTKNAIGSQSTVNSLTYTTSNQLRSGYLCVDSNKGPVSHKNSNVPALSSCSSSTSQEVHDVLEANAVASIATAAETIARTTNSGSLSGTASVVSPLLPSALISANTNSSLPPLVHTHHSHHYGITTYSNLSPTATVPILVHHLTNSHQTPYQYQNMPYPHQLHQSGKTHSTSYFTPISIPTINVLSAAASASNTYTVGDNEKMNLFPMGTKPYPKTLSEKNFLYNDSHYHVKYEPHESSRSINSSNTVHAFTTNHLNGESSYTSTYPFGPMDLSLRHSRGEKSEFVENMKSTLQMSEVSVKQEHHDHEIDVVDLTYRKRKAFSTPHSSTDYRNEFPEKQHKMYCSDSVQNKPEAIPPREGYLNNLKAIPSNVSEDDDIEIEVGIEEKFPLTSKPVKLFKPYLLDECENNVDKCINSNNVNNVIKTSNSEDIKAAAKKEGSEINENTFPDIVKENHHICVEGSNFHIESGSESPRSVCSPATYVPIMSPTNFHYPKESPASSGYESSTSTYSDTSLSSRNDTYTFGPTYSLNLQTIYQGNIHVLHQSKHVQRWLEKDDSNPMETNSTIALLV